MQLSVNLIFITEKKMPKNKRKRDFDAVFSVQVYVYWIGNVAPVLSIGIHIKARNA